MAQTPATSKVLLLRDFPQAEIATLFKRCGLELDVVPAGNTIPGSYWGDAEAGLMGNRLLAREDTPVHSLFHEACHYLCMDSDRRSGLDTNAGGDYEEENGVCYLQVLLADDLPGFGRKRMMEDMDAWGYRFRLGSAQRWFEEDAEDARAFLERHELIDMDERPTWKLRTNKKRP